LAFAAVSSTKILGSSILRPEDYDRWLSDAEPEPRDLLQPFPSELMTMWPVSTRVNTPKNDDADLLVPFVEASTDAPPDGNSA
jgi:putative SOS response-associated peptidase YedK